ncbi:MAG: methionyl-tRNA formyltransferase [Dehalococcoidia bacterium]|nr:methionyl-tRNA formyltransferase [Dehalococcoidia bacterium]
MRIIFLGTPEFALPTLARLHADGHQIVAVYTQPDRPAGRSGHPSPPAVKRWAVAHGIPVRQPRSLRREPAQGDLIALRPDALVLVAYGLLLPQAVLDCAPHGGLNLHPSLLPRHRGPAPVVGALLAGDTETGVSIMLMDAGMDTGPVLAQQHAPIEPADNAATLADRLAHVGANLMSRTLPRWATNDITAQPQDDAQATYTRILTKDDGLLDWRKPAITLAREVRAYQPWPGTATHWKGRVFKVLAADALPGGGSAAPGSVVAYEGGAAVATSDGLLVLREVQVEGRKPAPVAEFLRGARDFIDARLGDT